MPLTLKSLFKPKGISIVPSEPTVSDAELLSAPFHTDISTTSPGPNWNPRGTSMEGVVEVAGACDVGGTTTGAGATTCETGMNNKRNLNIALFIFLQMVIHQG